MRVEERPAHAKRKRKKRGRRLMMAYALQFFILVVLIVMIILMVCRVLYIKGHLNHTPDSGVSAENTENSRDGAASSGNSIILAALTIPGEVRVVLDAGHGGNAGKSRIFRHLPSYIRLGLEIAKSFR